MNDDYCKVYDAEDTFTGWVQVVLAFFALSSLYIKRQNEIPRRKFRTWFLDVSKQGFGAVYAHFMNMFIAAVLSDNVRGDYELKDQCAWYATTFFIDTTLGLVISVFLLHLVADLANKYEWTTLMVNGVYEGPDGLRIWRDQLISWMLILTVVKFVIILILWVFSPLLAVMGDFFFRPLQGNVHFELLFVMILFPGIMNFFYFWIADGYLKATPDHPEAHEEGVEVFSSTRSMYAQYDGELYRIGSFCGADSLWTMNSSDMMQSSEDQGVQLGNYQRPVIQKEQNSTESSSIQIV
jgi:hypothetical protein